MESHEPNPLAAASGEADILVATILRWGVMWPVELPLGRHPREGIRIPIVLFEVQNWS